VGNGEDFAATEGDGFLLGARERNHEDQGCNERKKAKASARKGCAIVRP